MREAVVLKSNRYGIQLQLNPDLPFAELLQKILEKFHESDKFFKGASFAISFEGRNLSEAEETAIVEAINSETNTHVICIVAEDEIREEILKRKTEETAAPIMPSYNPNEAYLRYESVKNGEVLIAEQSLVVLADVEAGATVTTAGNLIVLGALRGKAWAGSDGKEDVFVFAMNLEPESLRIGSLIYTHPEEKHLGWRDRKKKNLPKVAQVLNGSVQILSFEGRS